MRLKFTKKRGRFKETVEVTPKFVLLNIKWWLQRLWRRLKRLFTR